MTHADRALIRHRLRPPRRRYATRDEVALIAARVEAIFAEMDRVNAEAGYAPVPDPRHGLTVLRGGKAAS